MEKEKRKRLTPSQEKIFKKYINKNTYVYKYIEINVILGGNYRYRYIDTMIQPEHPEIVE